MKRLVNAAYAFACVQVLAQAPTIGDSHFPQYGEAGVMDGRCLAKVVAGITFAEAPMCFAPTSINAIRSGYVTPISSGSTYPVQSPWNYTTLFDAAAGYNDYSYGLTLTHKVNSGTRDYAENVGGQGNDASILNLQGEFSSPIQAGGLIQLEHVSHSTGDTVGFTWNVLATGIDRGTHEGNEPDRSIWAFEHAIFGGTLSRKGTDAFGRLKMQVTPTHQYQLGASGEDRLLINVSKRQVLSGTGTIGLYSDPRFSTITMDATLTAALKAAMGCAGATCSGGETTLTDGADTTIQSGCPAKVTGNYNSNGTNPYLTDYAGNGSRTTGRCIAVGSTRGWSGGRTHVCVWSGLNDWECQTVTTVLDAVHAIIPLQSVHDPGSLVTWGDGVGYGISSLLAEMPAGYLSSLENPQPQIERVVYPIVRVNGSTIEVFTNADVNGNHSELRLPAAISSSATPANSLTVFPIGKIYHLLDPAIYSTKDPTTHKAHTGYLVVDTAVPSLFASGETVEQSAHWQQYSIDQHIVQQSPYVSSQTGRVGPWAVYAQEYPQFEQIQYYFANVTRSSFYFGPPSASDPYAGQGGRPIAFGISSGHAMDFDIAFPEGSPNFSPDVFRIGCRVRGQDGKATNPRCLSGDYRIYLFEIDPHSAPTTRMFWDPSLYGDATPGFGLEGNVKVQDGIQAADGAFAVDRKGVLNAAAGSTIANSTICTAGNSASTVGCGSRSALYVAPGAYGTVTVGSPVTYTDTVAPTICIGADNPTAVFASGTVTVTTSGHPGHVSSFACLR